MGIATVLAIIGTICMAGSTIIKTVNGDSKYKEKKNAKGRK